MVGLLKTPMDESAAALVRAGAVGAAYQPVVRVATGEVTGYEALARGPAGSRLHLPGALFAQAMVEGVEQELDWACRAAAVGGALRAGLRLPAALFLNVEPSGLWAVPPAHLEDLMHRGRDELALVVEITERGLADAPATLLSRTERLRADGFGLALDDVGVDWRSLALLPFVQPDVIKLDRTLVQAEPGPGELAIFASVREYARQSDAEILAEGVETLEHAQRAMTFGATLLQGWRYGRPGPLPRAPAVPSDVLGDRIARHEPLDRSTPFEVIRRSVAGTVATRRDVDAITLGLEHEAARLDEPAVVLAAFQSAGCFSQAARRRYARLSAQSAYVGAFGTGMEPVPAPGVCGAALEEDEPLAREHALLVTASRSTVALVARDLGDPGPLPDPDRRYAVALTRDRDVVLRAARALMMRMAT